MTRDHALAALAAVLIIAGCAVPEPMQETADQAAIRLETSLFLEDLW